MQDKSFTILETFLTFHKVLNCIGFVPFEVNVNVKDKNIVIHERLVYYPAFFLSLYSAALLAICILGQQEPDAEESLLVRYGKYMLYMIYMAIVIFVVLFNYLKRHKIANCLLVMHHFDCMIEVCWTNEINCTLVIQNLLFLL